MTPIDLEAIRARLAAATPGPWAYIGQGWITHPGTRYDGAGAPVRYTQIPASDADADLIANAPTDLAALVAEVRTLRDRLDAAERVAELIATQYPGLSSEVDAALDAWRGGEGK